MNEHTRATRARQLRAMNEELTAEDVAETLSALQATRDKGTQLLPAQADVALRVLAYLQLQLEEYEDHEARVRFLLGGS